MFILRCKKLLQNTLLKMHLLALFKGGFYVLIIFFIGRDCNFGRAFYFYGNFVFKLGTDVHNG